MIIPKKIKIGPHTYKISYEKDLDRSHGVLGQSRHTMCQIVLEPGQNYTQLEDTLIHEILHCINAQVKFVEDEKNVEEDAITRLAPALLQVIKDNPGLFGGEKHVKA